MRWNRVFHAVVCGIVVAIWATVAQAAPVRVLIVEADGSPAVVGLQYAPVDFEGATPVVSGGITYHALSDPGSITTSTYSGHAATVRNRLIAADGPNDPVDVIYSMYAGDFLDDYVKTSPPSSTAVLPDPVGNDIKVVNHSWVGSYGAVAPNLDAVRRMDYMIRREDLVMVGGAVSPADGGERPLTWANWNGIAVRGSQTFTPSHADDIGKRRADLWGTGGAASYQTPDVAGYAAALVDAADASGWNNGLNGIRHEVVKSVLMTGADKTAFDSLFTSWTNNGVNNLDNLNGAGRADLPTSLAVLNGGPQTPADLAGTTISSPGVSTAMAGWWYEDALGAGSSQALVVDLSNQILTDLTATLAWDVTQAENGSFLDTTDNGVLFADLDLELFPVTAGGGTYTLGSSLGIPGLMSNSTGSESDNVEHLYFADGALSPGLYAFVVSNNGDVAWDYGFSYRMDASVIPEPATILLLLAGAAWAACRRRTKRFRPGG